MFMIINQYLSQIEHVNILIDLVINVNIVNVNN